jgi:hypothetical protein
LNNIKNDKKDSITNYKKKVHSFSHKYWDPEYRNILQLWDKKRLTQLNSGTVYNKSFNEPSRCKFCKNEQSLKHSLLECSALQGLNHKVNRNILLGTYKSILRIHQLALLWEDDINFNKKNSISPRGNISIKLGNYIKKNNLEKEFHEIKADFYIKYTKTIMSE